LSGYSAASRAAFARVNISAGQARILDFLRARPRLRPTREEIATLTGMKLSTICGRVNELLYDFDPPLLRELPVRDGAHPLELIEHAPRSSHCAGNLGGEFHSPDPLLPATSGHKEVAAPGARSPRYVHPYLPHRMSVTLDEARRSTGEEAAAVVKLGRQFRVWGEDLAECVRVAVIVGRA